MKGKPFVIVSLLCVPIGILVIAGIKRQAAYQGRPAVVWLDRIKIGEKSSALGAMQHLGKAGVPALEDALKSPEALVRVKAAWVLGQLGRDAQAAIPALARTWDDECANVVEMSMQAIGAIDPLREDVVPKLVARLSSSNDTSHLACDLLWRIERERRAKNLSPPFTNEYDFAMAFARSPVPYVRVRGAYRLANMSPQDDRVRTALQALAKDPHIWVRDRTVVFMKYPNAIPPENMNWAYSP